MTIQVNFEHCFDLGLKLFSVFHLRLMLDLMFIYNVTTQVYVWYDVMNKSLAPFSAFLCEPLLYQI